ncbi:hypothetical protein SDC9_195881 [bioreactor metagenome]|uniref:Uncharacterized protein n=1 Tax=bioreactor metagenome TaxID=1076179 RepID=A0A645IAI3_9ZZZZ
MQSKGSKSYEYKVPGQDSYSYAGNPERVIHDGKIL